MKTLCHNSPCGRGMKMPEFPVRRCPCSWRFSRAEGVLMNCHGTQLSGISSSAGAKLIQESSHILKSDLCWKPGIRRPSKLKILSNYSRQLNGARCCQKKLVVPEKSSARQEARKSRSEPSQEHIRTLLLDNYDSYTYNLYQQLSVINGVAPVVFKNDEITWDDLCYLLYEERAFHNVVISPGPGSPTCASDVGICMQLLQECHDIPILGVCLGHQALGCVHGARILHAPEPVHGRLSEIEHNGHPLFESIPSGANSGFKVVRYHSLMVDATTLPQDLVPTAWTVVESELAMLNDWQCGIDTAHASLLCESQLSWQDRVNGNFRSGYSLVSSNVQPIVEIAHKKCNTKVLMGVSHTLWPHHGVQFHPESIATSYGKQILENFRNITVKFWEEQLWRPTIMVNNRVISRPPSIGPLFGSLKGLQQVPEGSMSLFPVTSSPSDQAEGVPHLNHSHSPFAANVKKGTNERACNALIKPGQPAAKAANLRLHWRKLPRLAMKAGSSKNIFCKLFSEEGVEDSFWLDSSTVEQGRAQFSFMGGRGGSLWQRITYQIAHENMVDMRGGVLRVENAAGRVKETVLQEGFLDFLNRELGVRRCRAEDYACLPFNFCGGFVGYLGYELKVECGAKSNQHKSRIPDAAMFLADRMVVIDQTNDDVYVLALFQEEVSSSSSPEMVPRCGSDEEQDGFSNIADLSSVVEEGNGGSGRIEAEAWVEEVVKRVKFLAQQDEVPERMHRVSLVPPAQVTEEGIYPPFVADKSRNEYIRDVRRCQDFVTDGESYEVCLTNQMRRKVSTEDCLGLYLTLRETNPAPYSAWLHLGKDGPCICCSSPERFLQLDRTGVLEAKPIKGTVARGRTRLEDETLKRGLLHSDKDRAENLMIVDLLRNDLGRVCEPGTVHVPSLMAVESYSTVHMLVSTVRGRKRADVTPVDCVRAAFPGGSMTGAPKLRTMEIIDFLESSPRGVYSGSIGYFSFNSSFDLNIVIRTLVIHEGELSLGAGGAVIALSDPLAEYEEMLLKTRAPIKAINIFEKDLKLRNDVDQRVPVLRTSGTVIEPT